MVITSRQSELDFIPNLGQINSQALYYAWGTRYGIYLTPGDIRFDLINEVDQGKNEMQAIVVGLEFLNANSTPVVKARKESTGKFNCFKGKESFTGLSSYREIIYQDLWPGIDMVLHGDKQRLKYDIIVKPGADINDIQLKYNGVKSLSMDEKENLLISTDSSVLTEELPYCYQEINGERITVEAKYVLNSSVPDGECGYGFKINSAYNPDYALVIDPSLQYSTFLGGNDEDAGNAIAADADGYAYVAGKTYSADFPVVAGSYFTNLNQAFDAFVSKVSQDGSFLVWSSFLGGSGNDWVNGMVLDKDSNVYVAGSTDSPDFYISPGAIKSTMTGVRCAFISKLSADGTTVLYSSYLGGNSNDFAYDIALDNDDYAYVTGATNSPDFPITIGSPFSGVSDAFVTKINKDATAIVYSRLLGGDQDEHGRCIAVDSSGYAYVAGPTASDNFPTTIGAYDITHNGNYDGFVCKLDHDGSLIYSTFIGGSEDEFIDGIGLDHAGNAYITGSTGSSDYPTTPGVYQENPLGDIDIFVTRLNSAGSALVFSTRVGGSNADHAHGIAVDIHGNSYVAGSTSSTDYPTTGDAFSKSKSLDSDGVFFKLNSTGTGLLYSTYLGGQQIDEAEAVAIDPWGNAYLTGFSYSEDFPVSSGAYQEIYAGWNDFSDAFVLKFYFEDLPQVCGAFRLTRFVVNTTDDFPDETQQMDADFILPCDDRKVIHGIVRDPDGTPIPAAVVVFFKLAAGFEQDDPETSCNIESIGHAITDDCGQFIVGPLPPDVNLIMKIFCLKNASVTAAPSPIIGTASPIGF